MYRGISKSLLISYIMSGYVGLSDVEKLESSSSSTHEAYKGMEDEQKSRFMISSKNRLTRINDESKKCKKAHHFYNTKISWWTTDIKYALTYGEYILCNPKKLKKSQFAYIYNGRMPLSECDVYHMPEGGIIKHLSNIDLLKIKERELKKAMNKLPKITI